MFRRLLALASLLGASALMAACLSDADPGEFEFKPEEGACIPGFQVNCGCPAGLVGIQACTSEERFGPCECPDPITGNPGTPGTPPNTGPCTLFPDCGGCESCFETCVCQTGGEDIDGCRELCLQAGPTPGGSCDVGQCPPAAVGESCCTDDGECGVNFASLAPEFNGCVPRDGPGSADPSCPELANVLPITLPGCCTPRGVCGILEPGFIGLGCVDIEQFLGPQQSC